MDSSEKFLLDVVLVGLICVLVWTGLRRNRQDKRGRDETC
jgi:hypothetical protein